jgi:DNA-binding PadR family transcriptional regulator
MLELAILGLLKEQELHGYELKKRLVEQLGFASGVSFGSLYPALSRLESAGAVKAVESRPGPAVPHTGSLGGEMAALRARGLGSGLASGRASGRGSRGKKVYGITTRGEELFDELLATESQSNDDDRLFNLRLAFARYLPPDARIGMLERRRAQLSERLIQLRTRVKVARDAYARSLVEHDREAAEHDLTWVERLLAAERSASSPAPSASSAAASAGVSGAAPAVASASADDAAGRAGSSRPAAAHSPTISGLLRPLSTNPISSPEEDTSL